MPADDEREPAEWLGEGRAQIETVAGGRDRLEARVEHRIERGGVLVGATLLVLAATLGWAQGLFVAIPILTAGLIACCETLYGVYRSLLTGGS